MDTEGYEIETDSGVEARDVGVVGEDPEGEVVKGLGPGLEFGFSFWVGGEI